MRLWLSQTFPIMTILLNGSPIRLVTWAWWVIMCADAAIPGCGISTWQPRNSIQCEVTKPTHAVEIASEYGRPLLCTVSLPITSMKWACLFDDAVFLLKVSCDNNHSCHTHSQEMAVPIPKPGNPKHGNDKAKLENWLPNLNPGNGCGNPKAWKWLCQTQSLEMAVPNWNPGNCCAKLKAWKWLCQTQSLEMAVTNPKPGNGYAKSKAWKCLCQTQSLEMALSNPKPGNGCVKLKAWKWLCQTQILEMAISNPKPRNGYIKQPRIGYVKPKA